jgi:hypothetical protein
LLLLGFSKRWDTLLQMVASGGIGMLDRGGGAAADNRQRLCPKTVIRPQCAAVAVRICVVLVALAIVYFRTPTTFTNAQFWGENVALFQYATLNDGPL